MTSLQFFLGSVSAYSFIQAYGLLTRAHIDVCVATPNGKSPKFHCEEEEEETWIEQHKNILAEPKKLAEVVSAEWDALCIPSSIGAVVDLGTNDRLGTLVSGFAAAEKPVCVIGYGVLGLARAVNGAQMQWVYEGYNVTGYSNLELARLPYFTKLPLLPEEFVVENAGIYDSSVPDAVFVCIDRTLISGQNVRSTSLAVLNLVWLLNSP